jgi:hypothetical protein
MKINVTVTRSKEFIKQQRIETGENVSDEVVVEIDTQMLDAKTRENLLSLTWSDSYPSDIRGIGFSNEFQPGTYSYGREEIRVDAVSPQTLDVCVAIKTAFESIAAKREEWLARQAALQAEREAAEKLKAEKAAKLEEAKILLKDIIDERDRLKNKLSTVCGFLSEVPLDALRGTVKRLVSSDDKIDEYEQKIEDASPEWIFDRE